MTSGGRRQALGHILDLALKEDLGSGDITEALLPSPQSATARLRARRGGVWCGSGISDEVFTRLGLAVVVERRLRDGEVYTAGADLEVWQGPGVMTSAERVILNLLQHLGAIATETARWVAALKGTGCQLFDTRKTTPGWRAWDKYAVRCGGGHNHRQGLWDMVMIKDNHLARAGSPRGAALTAFVDGIVTRAKVPVIVEVEDLDACLDVCRASPAVVLLDNMSVAEMAECVKAVKELGLENQPELEASGGVVFDKLRAIAATGVNRISAGALTQSPPRIDLGLDWQ